MTHSSVNHKISKNNLKFYLFLGKTYLEKGKFPQTTYFLKKSLCNSIWVLQTQILKVVQSGGVDKRLKKVRGTLKYLVLIFLNYFVKFLNCGNLEKVGHIL